MSSFRRNLDSLLSKCTCASFKSQATTCFNCILNRESKDNFRSCFKPITKFFRDCFKSSNRHSEPEYFEMTIGSNADMLMYVKETYPDLDAEVRAILMARAQDGATIREIYEDYYRLVGVSFPEVANITEYLLSIPFVSCFTNHNGSRIFNIMPSEKNCHLFSMVMNQKPSKESVGLTSNNFGNHFKRNNNNQQRSSDKSSSRSDSEGFHEMNCYFEDNYNYLQSRFSVNKEVVQKSHSNYYQNLHIPKPTPFMQRGSSSPAYTKSSQSYDSFEDNEAPHLCDFQLFGDDFFLYMARMELNFKAKSVQKVLQSGLCISGLSIAGAIKRIRKADSMSLHKRMIVNIGSVDVLSGAPLIQIEHDFMALLDELYSRNVYPVLTTLAPLANVGHNVAIQKILLSFNEFIKRQSSYQVIDIYQSMVSIKGHILFDCFQSEPRRVSGCRLPHVFWNKIGRQRILKHIISELEY